MKTNNIPIKYSEYNDQVFGSWYIELMTKPFYKVIYDGKDSTLDLQKYNSKEWSQILCVNSQSSEEILNQLTSELNAI